MADRHQRAHMIADYLDRGEERHRDHRAGHAPEPEPENERDDDEDGVEGEAPGHQHRRHHLTFEKVDAEIDAGEQHRLPQRIESQHAAEKDEDDAGHRPDHRDIVEEERHHSPQQGIAEAADPGAEPDADADQKIHAADRHEIGRDVLFYFLRDGDGMLLVAEARQHLDQLAQEEIAGDLFLRKLDEVLPRFGDKKHAVAISQEVEEHISAYLVTISGMNLLVGVGVGLSAWIGGLGDPLLWGVMAFLLNYVPVIGPMAGIVLVFLGGMLTFDALWKAVLLAGVYLGIHLLEGEVVTPMLVARRFTLNPVLVIISLIFWFWLWGVPGAVIAVPLLATVKIICDHVRPLMAIGHFIGG